MRHPGRTEPGRAVGGVGKLSRATRFAALSRLAARVVSRGVTAALSRPAAVSRAALPPAPALSVGARRVLSRAALSVRGRSRAGVTEAVHEAGIVAHTSGTIGGRAGVVSARADCVAASLALPAFSQAKSA